MTLLLPASRPLYLREGGSGREIRIVGTEPVISVASLAPRPPSAARRGAEHEAFTRLFEAPFSRESIAVYHEDREREMTALDDVGDGGVERLMPWLGLGGVAAAGVGAGVIAAGMWDRVSAERDGSHRAQAEFNDRASVYRVAGVGLVGVGTAALLAYGVWALWPGTDVDVQLQVADDSGGGLSLGGRW